MSTSIFTGVEHHPETVGAWSDAPMGWSVLAGTKNIWSLSFEWIAFLSWNNEGHGWWDPPDSSQGSCHCIRAQCFVSRSGHRLPHGDRHVMGHAGLLQRVQRLYWTAKFIVEAGIESCTPSFSCVLRLYCLLLWYFRQDWISTGTVDKPVGKLPGYPMMRPVQTRCVTDRPINEQ